MSQLTDKTKEKMNSALDHLRDELKSVRTGRANPSAFELVNVEAYGSHMRLKEVAQISAPDARMILITPYDPQMASSIQKSIEKANLNVKPTLDGTNIRISIQPMDGNTREAMKKMCHEYAEKAKIQIRQIRQEANQVLKKQKADKTIAEDIANSEEKKVQELTDEACKKCEELCHLKEKELSTI